MTQGMPETERRPSVSTALSLHIYLHIYPAVGHGQDAIQYLLREVCVSLPRSFLLSLLEKTCKDNLVGITV